MTPVPILVAWREPASEIRIKIVRWLVTEPVQEQYIVHPRSLWLLWNYWRRVGARSMLRKIRSRVAERRRNLKVYGLGIGKVLEAPNSSTGIAPGRAVLFFATNHNADAKLITLHPGLLAAIDSGTDAPVGAPVMGTPSIPAELERYIGWSPYSGRSLDEAATRAVLAAKAAELGASAVGRTSAGSIEPVYGEEIPVVVAATGKRSAVLFGLGNYAKTAIIPNIDPYLSLQRVHEIDPEQMAFFGARPRVSLDTSPEPRANLRFDAWFIAGFHHSHARLAVAALRQNACAVIEKPLATTRTDYERFAATLKEMPDARFFLCFHKRYSQLHEFAVRDLAVRAGEPVDMHTVVYEIPLPPLHWYNWPNSGSRIISNGCHWIDYFMLMNDWAQAVEFNVWRPRGDDVCVQLKLENGAYFSMALTDNGSQRIGVREHIELRHGGTTVTVTDAADYHAENRQRIFRRASVNPMAAYGLMYRKIAKAIAGGQGGDCLKSLRSSELTLTLEEELMKRGR